MCGDLVDNTIGLCFMFADILMFGERIIEIIYLKCKLQIVNGSFSKLNYTCSNNAHVCKGL